MALTENEDIMLVDMQEQSSTPIGLAARDPSKTSNIGSLDPSNKEATNIGLAARGDDIGLAARNEELPSIENNQQVAGIVSVPSSSTAYIPTVDDINAGELSFQEKVLQERAQVQLVRKLEQAEKPNSVFGYYGSFVTEIDFNEATYDSKTKTYSDVTLMIEPNHDIPGYSADEGYVDSFAMIPDGLTKEQILKVKRQMEGDIMKSGDLTYNPQANLTGLFTVAMAEKSIGPQSLRALFNTLPVAGGFWMGRKLLPKFEDIKSGKRKFGYKQFGWAATGFAASTAVLYGGINELVEKYITSDFDVQGYAAALYAMQEAEIQLKGIDPTKTRRLTTEQYAALLDPTFGSYWTKFVNTAAEGTVGTATFLSGLGVKVVKAGGSRISKTGELVSIFGNKKSVGRRGSNDFMVNIHKRAMDKLNLINKERIAGGLTPHIISKKRVLSEAKLIIADDKLKLKEHMPGAIFRMIYGFRHTQKASLFVDKPLYYSELAFGELGAGGLVSFESYYRAFKSSPRTEDIDKLPFLVTGAIFGPQATGAVTAKLSPIGATLRATSLFSDFIGTGDYTKATFDFLTGKELALPKNMDVKQREAILKVKKKIGVMDQELQGDVTRSLQTGIELTNEAVKLSKRIAKKFNDPSLVLDPQATLATFTQLEVVGGLEHFLMEQSSGGRATSEAMQATVEKLFRARKEGKTAADELLKKLILMGEDSAVLNNSAYMKIRESLENSMLRIEGDSAQRTDMLLNDVIGYQVYSALDDIMTNPYQGTKQVNEIISFLNSDSGKNLKLDIGGQILDAKEAAIQLNVLAAEELEAVYRKSIDKSIAAANNKGDADFIGPVPDSKVKINATKVNEKASEYFATLLKSRVDNAINETDRLYKLAYAGSENYKIDVTDLYSEMAEDVLINFGGAQNVMAGDGATTAAFRFFKKAARDGMNNYIKKVGDGNAEEGLKIINDLIDAGELKGLLTKTDLASPRAFAKAMLIEKNMDTIAQKLGAGEFKMEILTQEYSSGVNQIGDTIAAFSNVGSVDRVKIEQMTAVSDKLKLVLEDNMSEADQMLLMQAENYWKKNVLDVRETNLYRKTLGTETNIEYADDSVLGLKYNVSPKKWAENIWDGIRTSGDASAFFEDFNKVFPEGSVGRRLALSALDDAAISKSIAQRASVGSFPVSGPIRPDAIGVGAIEAPKVTTQSTSTLDPDSAASPDSAFVKMRQKTEWMRDASSNEYFSGSYDIYEKVATAVKYSKKAKDEVNIALGLLAKVQIDKEKLVRNSIVSNIKKANAIMQQTLGTGMKALNTNNPGALVQEMLDKPEIFDAVLTSLTAEIGEKEAKTFIRTLIGKGIHDISTPVIAVGKTAQEGMPKVVEQYDPLALAKLMEDSDELLQTVFDPEHLKDIKIFTKFMMRMTPDPKAGEKLGGGYAGKFKKAKQFNLSHASIISRVYAAESGRTSFRYIGAEAVLGVMMNSDNDVLTAIFMDQKIAKGLSEFLLDPTKSIRDTQGNIVTWVHELTGLSQSLGGAIFEVAEAGLILGASGFPAEDEQIRQARMQARKDDKLFTDVKEAFSGYGMDTALPDLPPGRRGDRVDPETGEVLTTGENIEAAEDAAYKKIAPNYKEDIGYIIDGVKKIIEDETQKIDLESIQDMQSN